MCFNLNENEKEGFKKKDKRKTAKQSQKKREGGAGQL